VRVFAAASEVGVEGVTLGPGRTAAIAAVARKFVETVAGICDG